MGRGQPVPTIAWVWLSCYKLHWYYSSDQKYVTVVTIWHCKMWFADLDWCNGVELLLWLTTRFLKPCLCKPIQCTMVKLKNGVKSSQLWQIISPTIFNKNLPNFERWCKNIQKIIYLPNIMKIVFLDSKTPVGGVCSSQDWSKKKLSAKILFFFIKWTFWANTPK